MSAKYVIKLLTLGDSLVGKTSIVMRYSDNKFADTFATIGIDFKTKFFTIKNQVVKVIIWDTAGQEKFRNIVNQYYKGADGVLLTYDITSRKTFNNVQEWIKQYQFIELTTNKKGKFRLEEAGRIPSTLAIEDELMKWVSEQRRCEIGITTEEIINKSKELDENQKKSQTALEHWVLYFLILFRLLFTLI